MHDAQHSTSFQKVPQTWRAPSTVASKALDRDGGGGGGGDVRSSPSQSLEQTSPATARKLTDVIVTSNIESEAECKSESQPLFVRPAGERRLGDKRRRVVRMLKRKIAPCQNKRSIIVHSTPKPKTASRIERHSPETGHSSQITRRDNGFGYQTLYDPFESTIMSSADFYQTANAIFGQRYVMPSFNSMPTSYDYTTFQNTIPWFNPLEEKKFTTSSQSSNFNRIPLDIKKKPEKTSKMDATTQKSNSSTKNPNEVKKIVIEFEERNKTTLRANESPVVTKIILKPVATAKAGAKGVAISSPLSTAYIKRGDYVEIEYVPEASAQVGEGGVAISRPELYIHFIDRRRK